MTTMAARARTMWAVRTRPWVALAAALALAACAEGGPGDGSGTEEAPQGGAAAASQPLPDTADRVQVVTGLAGPESVRYDPDQDVWFVGNFNGDAGERDGNGFVSRVDAATGRIVERTFAVGTEAAPLHAARGIFLAGDTLWVADIDGIHGFHRVGGEQLAFVDLSAFEPGFLNDIARGPDGALYVTDTGRSAVYRVEGGRATEAVASLELGGPNGITWDPDREAFVLLPWEPGHPVHAWTPGGGARPLGPATTPGRLDGVEAVGGRLLLASQTDSSLLVLEGGELRPAIRVAGPPADMGVDTRRGRVAVPYVGLDRVDVWALPGG